MTTKEEFLAPSKRRVKALETPSGKKVSIQNMLTSEMREFRNGFSDRKGEVIISRSKKLQELLIGRCVLNDSGSVMLTDAEVMSGALDNLDGADTAYLFNECKLWTGFGNDGDWSAVEDAAKNSEATPKS